MAALQLRPKHRTLHNPSLVNLFSTSQTPPEPTPADQAPSSTSPHPAQSQSQSQSSISSSFSDVKAILKHQQQEGPRRPTNPSNPLNPSLSGPSKVPSFEEIRKNLPEFLRRPSSVPPPTEPNSASSTSSSSQHISFQELSKRNATAKADENGANAESGPGKLGGRLQFEAIHEGLRQMLSSSPPGAAQNERSADPMSLSEYKNSLKLKPSPESGPVIGGTGMLPASVFGKETERKGTEGETTAMKTEFVKMYSYNELGKKEEEAPFSFGELKERLIKLREMETESRIGGVSFKDLRESLLSLRMSDDEKAKKSSMMDSQTPQSSCYTNLINEDDLGFERTNEISEHQEASPQVEVEHTIRKSCRGSNFTMVDDNLLVEAWLYVSMDAVQGNQQKNKVYWKRICDYFHERKTLGANRNQTCLMNRWSTIQLAVNKFCGFLAQIEKRSQSGLTEQDKICQARQMFVDIQKSPFNFEHSWLILRFHSKWLAHLDNIKLKKKPVVINLGDEKVPHKAFEEIERPIGGKAENEKRKSKEKIKLFEEACEQDKEMFFLKQEEVRLRERELRLREKTLRLEEEREIKEFMLLDISQLDEDGKEYVRRRKKAILQGCGTSVDDVISGDILLSRE